jgi:hypothetical protein
MPGSVPAETRQMMIVSASSIPILEFLYQVLNYIYYDIPPIGARLYVTFLQKLPDYMRHSSNRYWIIQEFSKISEANFYGCFFFSFP